MNADLAVGGGLGRRTLHWYMSAIICMTCYKRGERGTPCVRQVIVKNELGATSFDNRSFADRPSLISSLIYFTARHATARSIISHDQHRPSQATPTDPSTLAGHSTGWLLGASKSANHRSTSRTR